MSGFKSPQEYQQYLRSQLSSLEVRGLFRAIAAPEGTLNSDGTFAYWKQFGGNNLDPAKLGPGHPGQVINRGGYSSAATGFAQFMPDTWNGANQALGGNLDFRKPQDQEVAALYLARERTKDLGGIGYLKQKGLTPEFVAKLAPEWASLPTLEGKSFYGQPVKPYDFVKQKYDEGMKTGSTVSATPTEIAQTLTETTQSTSPTITENDDGTQTVSVPGGVTVNLKINNGEENKNDAATMLRNTFRTALIQAAKGTDLTALIDKEIYPSIEKVLA